MSSEVGAGCGERLETIDVGARNFEKWAISSALTELKAGMELCALRSETAAVRANLREASMISALRLAKKKSDQDNEANSGMTRSCGGNKVRAESCSVVEGRAQYCSFLGANYLDTIDRAPSIVS